MKFTKNLLCSLVLSAILLPVGAEGLKVATVNSAKIIQSYPAAQNLLQDIAKAESDINKKIQAKREKIVQAKEQNKTQTELQMLAEQMRLEIEPEAKKLEEESAKKSKNIEEKIKSTIKSVAEAGKYDLVLVEEAVLYGGNDISDEVLKKLGK